MSSASKPHAVVSHFSVVADNDPMSGPRALAALAALGQWTRIEIFRLLMRHVSTGLAAGTIAEAIGCPHNTLSTHLAILARAGLVRGTRQGRGIIYRADVEGMRALVSFLVTECCDGHPELCNLTVSAMDAGCGCDDVGARRERRGRR